MKKFFLLIILITGNSYNYSMQNLRRITKNLAKKAKQLKVTSTLKNGAKISSTRHLQTRSYTKNRDRYSNSENQKFVKNNLGTVVALAGLNVYLYNERQKLKHINQENYYLETIARDDVQDLKEVFFDKPEFDPNVKIDGKTGFEWACEFFAMETIQLFLNDPRFKCCTKDLVLYEQTKVKKQEFDQRIKFNFRK